MKTRVHISLPVQDLEASIDFYQRLFDAPVTERKKDYANFRLDTPALHLALYPGKPAESRLPSHFGVELFENGDLEAWQARLQSAGISGREEEQATCCYAVADKFWAADPDGHEWEFWVRQADSEERVEPQTACC